MGKIILESISSCLSVQKGQFCEDVGVMSPGQVLSNVNSQGLVTPPCTA